MGRPEIHVRTLMIAVGVIGMGVAFGDYSIRSRGYAKRAAHHALREAECKKRVAELAEHELDLRRKLQTVPGLSCGWADVKSQMRGYAKVANWHGLLNVKYRYAAVHPWISVEPDPKRPLTVQEKLRFPPPANIE
jgi:hypothetical protein